MTQFKDWLPQGVIPAVLLPFKPDFSIDESAYRRHLRDVAGVGGVSALTVNGHSSEVHACTVDEQRAVMQITMDELGDRLLGGERADVERVPALAREMVERARHPRGRRRIPRGQPGRERFEGRIVHPQHWSEDIDYDGRRAIVILVTTDKGLCGAINVNALRAANRHLLDNQLQGRWVTIGKKGRDFLARFGRDIIADASELGDYPSFAAILPAITVALQEYEKGEADTVLMVYEKWISTLRQEPTVRTLLPIEIPKQERPADNVKMPQTSIE